jgi:hypothetical protein
MSKRSAIEKALAKRWERELITAIRRSQWENGGKEWKPAPPDPGVKPGGIRDRAIKAMNARGSKAGHP